MTEIAEQLTDTEKALLIIWKKEGIPQNIRIAIIQAVRNRNGFIDEAVAK